MTKRSTSLRFAAGTTHVGTARVHDESRPAAMTAAQRQTFNRTGNRPQADSGFDDIADGIDAPPVMTPAYRHPDANARVQALGRLKAGEMNKTEQRYADHLETRKRTGEVESYRFEAMKFRLANNTFYTPDFIVLLTNGQLEAHEVKGFWRDDARAKIKVAAYLHPIRFIAVREKPKKAGGGWHVEEF